MKVVILKTGEIKEVAEGYARNFLFPQKEAVPATEKAIKEAEANQKALQDDQTKKSSQDEEFVKKLKGLIVKIGVKASEEGKLFAALTIKEIKKALKEQCQLEIPENYFNLEKAIKKIGDHEIEIKTPTDLKIKLKLNIYEQK